jgi:hypothetical protein
MQAIIQLYAKVADDLYSLDLSSHDHLRSDYLDVLQSINESLQEGSEIYGRVRHVDPGRRLVVQVRFGSYRVGTSIVFG